MIDLRQRFDQWPWGGAGQDLDEFPAPPHPWRVVACLNVWNDVDELRRTLPLWIGSVDAVLAIDGAYREVQAACPESTDGTREFLAGYPSVCVIPTSGLSQIEKRNVYLAEARPGDLLWVVDADEYIPNADVLRSVPWLDVGWVECASPLYGRVVHTPRLFRAQPGLQYGGRHHWVRCGPDLVASHQEGGAGYLHRSVPLRMFNSRGVFRADARQYAHEAVRSETYRQELTIGRPLQAHEPLRIFHSGPFDPGGVMSRLHTALNSTTPHESAMAPNGGHPFGYPKQYDLTRDRALCRDLAATADVVHHHVTYAAHDLLGVRGRWTVMHHHGTEYRRAPAEYNALDAERAGLRLISNLELRQYGEGLRYLPNPVPVARYARLREGYAPTGTVRIGHSPSKPSLKGTAQFVATVERLRARGLPVEAVVIQGQSIAESLKIKATCDLFFDSFWLGLQCSGLEAAAIGMPIIAGDRDCKAGFEEWLGAVPYTYANDEHALAETIERLVVDRKYRAAETMRVRVHVWRYHDGAAVAQRYLEYLDEAFAWREALALKAAA